MASGDTLLIFTVQSAESPSSNYPTFDVRNGISVLDYDDTTAETAHFTGFMPRNYTSGGLTVTIGWMATSATSGTVQWEVAFKSVTDDADDLDTKAYAAVNTTSVTTASASGEVDYATITFTDGADMDSIAKGEMFRMSVGRNPAGSDTMTGDAELVFIEIRET